MRRVALPLALLVVYSGVLTATITKCSLSISRLHVHVIPSSDDNYAVRIPQSATPMVQVSDENEHLYVSESRPSNGESIELMIPRGIELELDVSHKAKVLIDQHNGQMHARISNGGVLHLVKGALSQLTLEMSGASTVFAPDCVVSSATIRMSNDADAVLERVSSFAEKSVTRGARLYCNNECLYGGERGSHDEFSLARVYKVVGEKLTSAMAFYDVCASEPLVLRKRDMQSYDGNPQNSDNKQIQEALAVLARDVTSPTDIDAVATAISAVPAEYDTERQILGAMVCRRLMLCALAQPVGHGAISPSSLWGMGQVSEEFRPAFNGMLKEMYESSQLLLTHSLLSELGAFGEFYRQSAESLSRVRSRVLNTGRGVNRHRWVPFMDHMYKNIDAFVREGKRFWVRGKA
jgi:hypothetical protein